LSVVRTRIFGTVAVRSPRVVLPLASDLARVKIIAGAARDRLARGPRAALEIVPAGLGFARVIADPVG
jgi:hypothetical protein